MDRLHELGDGSVRQRLRPRDPGSFGDENVRQLGSVLPGLMPLEPSEGRLIARAVALNPNGFESRRPKRRREHRPVIEKSMAPSVERSEQSETVDDPLLVG